MKAPSDADGMKSLFDLIPDDPDAPEEKEEQRSAMEIFLGLELKRIEEEREHYNSIGVGPNGVSFKNEKK